MSSTSVPAEEHVAPELCTHCGLPIPADVRLEEEFAGQPVGFCCRGCRGAFRIINGAGLASFYRERRWPEPGLPAGSFASAADPEQVRRYVRETPDGAELTFLVEGVRCATCVWLNEKILASLPGVSQARINYATHRARVLFDPGQLPPERIFAAVSELGYLPRLDSREAEQQARQRERRSGLIRFGTAAFLSLQLMGFSLALYSGYFKGMEPSVRMTLQVFAGVLATPVVFFAGAPFLQGAWRGLRHGVPNMDLLVALGVLAAYGFSLQAMATGGEVYFDTAAMIVTLILLGRLLETAARHRAATGIERLLELAPAEATRLEADGPATVDSASLGPGDLILVGPGQRLPVDGAVTGGESEFDESVVTGEPLPVLRRPGDRTIAGSLNITTALTVRVTGTARDSFLARVARLVEETQARKAPVQRLADRIAARFVPGVALLAAATWSYWAWREAGADAVLNAVAVLVVACPCALGLATPTAVMAAAGAAARRGIFFRGGDVLEKVGRLDLVAFDKTGTLTEGSPTVVDVRPAPGITPDELLTLAARIENGSAHPLGRGIRAEAQRRGLAAAPEGGARAFPGRGVRLAADGTVLRAGTAEFLAEAGVIGAAGGADDRTEVHVARDTDYLGVIRLEDSLRPEAAGAVAALKHLGLETFLLTGDGIGPARQIARQAGIERFAAELTPADKAAWVEERQAEGKRVLMVGDGINDAPALAAADVGCALAGGTDIALETSDLVLTRPDLLRLVAAVRCGRQARGVIRQNLFWAFAYNLAALPLAAAGFLAPIHAAAAMALSSICVVLNSLRLTRATRE